MKQIAPHGSWVSTITEEMVSGKSPKLSETRMNSGRVFWLEALADENGRSAVMMHDQGINRCVLPRPLSVKSKAHEYGGGAYTVYENTLFFVLGDDQKIYRLNIDGNTQTPEVITAQSELRFADLEYDPTRRRLIAICEDHTNNTKPFPENYLVSISLDEGTLGNICSMHQGRDFYSNPKLSPDGHYLSWLTWDQPDMPWDSTTLWVAKIHSSGTLDSPTPLTGSGNKKESLFQPQWSEEGDLYFVSDKSDWWNLYRIPQHQLTNHSYIPISVHTMEAEFATPQWVFGMSTYGFLDKTTIFSAYTKNGSWNIATLNTRSGTRKTIESNLTDIESISAFDGKAVFIGSNSHSNSSIYQFTSQSNSLTSLTNSVSEIDSGEISPPHPIEIPIGQNQQAFGFYYAPLNKNFTGNDEPPLIVLSHGGPTGTTGTSLNLKIQFWTNRGFAVVDVNYRGSTGYGRPYRESLYHKWGICDVEDVCAAAEHAVVKGWCDKNKLIIKGSSAGGYTTLAALAFTNTFSAGVSLYGIGDLELLATDTHKFEARYLDNLIGRYPEERELYKKRSPLYSIDTINCPILVFQGMEDKVVPPNQADAFVRAVAEKGLPVSHVTYANEGHGFRNSETITHMLNAELEFYCAIFDIPRHTKNSYITLKNFPPANEVDK